MSRISWLSVLAIDLPKFFAERNQEIEDYLKFLTNVEEAARLGPPKFQGTGAAITPVQKKILSSGLYVQLYNLIEATVLQCLASIASELEEAECIPSQFSAKLRAEWVRSMARTHEGSLSSDHRLQAALELCEQLLQKLPVTRFEINVGGGGNWDDHSIEDICKRVGCDLALSPDVRMAVKRHMRDDMGALKLVKDRRNQLAHGKVSFVECSDDVTVGELKELAESVSNYLGELVESFVRFIEIEVTENATRSEQKGVITL